MKTAARKHELLEFGKDLRTATGQGPQMGILNTQIRKQIDLYAVFMFHFAR